VFKNALCADLLYRIPTEVDVAIYGLAQNVLVFFAAPIFTLLMFRQSIFVCRLISCAEVSLNGKKNVEKQGIISFISQSKVWHSLN